MKDIFYEDKIIPYNSIKCIEINSDINNSIFNIMIRQSGNSYKIFSSDNKELVNIVFEKLKEQCDGINFSDIIKKSEKILNEKNNSFDDKVKRKRKKVSDSNDRKE